MLDRRLVRKTFKISRQLADLLIMLAEKEYVTADDIKTATGCKAPIALVYRMRRMLAEHGIELQWQRDVGYWIDADAQLWVSNALHDIQGLSARQADNSAAGSLAAFRG